MVQWIKQNRLYDLARQGKRITPWWAVLILSVAIIRGSALFALPISIVQFFTSGFSPEGVPLESPSSPLLGTFFEIAYLVIPFGAVILLVWLWVGVYEKRPFSSLGFERPKALFLYGRGLLIGVLTFLGTIGLMALFGYVAPEASDPAKTGFAALGSIVLILIPGWLIQGAAEEVLTRGWMLPVLSARYRPWVGLLISAVFFAVMHGSNPNISGLALINLALYGLFAALYALREESLWGICAFHSVWNWVQGNLFGFQVSGQESPVGTLFNLMETGPDWFTGGAFGPEGGLVTTLVLVLSCALILFWPQPAANSQSNSVLSEASKAS